MPCLLDMHLSHWFLLPFCLKLPFLSMFLISSVPSLHLLISFHLIIFIQKLKVFALDIALIILTVPWFPFKQQQTPIFRKPFLDGTVVAFHLGMAQLWTFPCSSQQFAQIHVLLPSTNLLFIRVTAERRLQSKVSFSKCWVHLTRICISLCTGNNASFCGRC